MQPSLLLLHPVTQAFYHLTSSLSLSSVSRTLQLPYGTKAGITDTRSWEGVFPLELRGPHLLSVCSRYSLSSRSTPRGLGGWVPQGRCPAQARVSRASEALSVADDESRGGPWPPPGRWAVRPARSPAAGPAESGPRALAHRGGVSRATLALRDRPRRFLVQLAEALRGRAGP